MTTILRRVTLFRLPYLPRFSGLALLLGLLGGCCANNTCDCQDLQQDSIYLRLNRDPAQGKVFSKTDIDTVYVLRYARTKTKGVYGPPARRPTDSVYLVRALRWSNVGLQRVLTTGGSPRTAVAGLNDTTVVVLNNTSPFPPSSARGKLADFSYALLVAPNRRGPRYVFRLDSVRLNGQYQGDGCCTCYQNTAKSVFRAGQPTDVTETGGVPRPLVFVKP